MQTDFNGAREKLGTVAATRCGDDRNAGLDATVYREPSGNHKVLVNNPGDRVTLDLAIVTTQGRVVHRNRDVTLRKGAQRFFTLPSHKLSKGVYMVTLTTDRDRIVKRVVY